MYTTRISKNKTLRKANGNYKPYPLRGKKNSIRIANAIREYNNNPENAQEIVAKKSSLLAKAKLRLATKLAAGWKAKDNSHYLEYLSHTTVTKTLYVVLASAIQAETKRRAEQSKIAIAENKAKIAEFKATYVPTGNTKSNPAFIDQYISNISRKRKRIDKTRNNKFQLRREMQTLSRAA